MSAPAGCIFTSVGVAFSVAFAAIAFAQAVHKDCAPLLASIDVQRRAIETARRVLSPDEASCALIDFSLPVAGECARVKAAAYSDGRKREAWTAAMVAWSALDGLRLQLRGVEDRLGVTCAAQ